MLHSCRRELELGDLIPIACMLGALPLMARCAPAILGTVSNATSPVSNAGTSQSVEQDLSVTLDGSGSTVDSSRSLTYTWEQTSGTAVSLSDTMAQSPTFTAPSTAGDLVFSLTVDDGAETNSSTTTVTITADPTLVGPYSGLSLSSVKSLTDKTLNTESITSSRTAPFEANRLDVSGNITADSTAGIFIRCNELVLDGTASFQVNGVDGSGQSGNNGGMGGSGTGCGGGGGGGAGAQGANGGMGGSGTDGTDGGFSTGTPGMGGTGTGATDASGYAYPSGGNGANGTPSIGLGGPGASGSNGYGGGGGGGGSSAMDGAGGGGCGGGLVVVVCNSVSGTGTAQANGGDGMGGGGGGGGGSVWSAFGSYSNAISTSVSGGAGGATAATDGMTEIYDLDLDAKAYGDTW